jgi:hypothetical protein
MRRRTLTLLSVLMALLFAVYGSIRVSEVRDLVLREYLRHKEFLYLKGKVSEKERAGEGSVRKVLEEMGLEPERVSVSELGVEVVMDLSWRVLPELVRRLEERFHLVSLEAVDNTGKGRFRVRLVVR